VGVGGSAQSNQPDRISKDDGGHRQSLLLFGRLAVAVIEAESGLMARSISLISLSRSPVLSKKGKTLSELGLPAQLIPVCHHIRVPMTPRSEPK
jgi:hypothetical protein